MQTLVFVRISGGAGSRGLRWIAMEPPAVGTPPDGCHDPDAVDSATGGATGGRRRMGVRGRADR